MAAHITLTDYETGLPVTIVVAAICGIVDAPANEFFRVAARRVVRYTVGRDAHSALVSESHAEILTMLGWDRS